jgi:hypothetical protein
MSGTATENPGCISRSEPPSPSTEALADPSEPHPDEPGAPADAPGRRAPTDADDGGRAGASD